MKPNAFREKFTQLNRYYSPATGFTTGISKLLNEDIGYNTIGIYAKLYFNSKVNFVNGIFGFEFTNNSLAKSLGINIRTLTKYLTELVDQNVITILNLKTGGYHKFILINDTYHNDEIYLELIKSELNIEKEK